MSDNIVETMLRDQRLDARRRDIIGCALRLARREQYVSRRESGDRYARVIFDCDRGEVRVVVEMWRHDDGQEAESLSLTVHELGSIVFVASARRLRLGNGHFRTIVAVHRDIQSYWEMILRHIS
ncbi:MAG TPA: hypothetical protein VL500_01620 [Candidatus Eisenbacteria bacterium]|nr:hypothetical protein [Candidatus Eisenbacteria bacterium]